MNIAIDFDDTLTADPEYWREVIAIGEARGHQHYFFTQRQSTADNQYDVRGWMKEHGFDRSVIFTDGRSKLEVAKERGMKISWWCDDDPVSLVRGR